MFTMSEKQKVALAAVKDEPDLMPIIHFGKLRDAGYVESASVSGGQRGYAGAKITAAGLTALG